jgi:hypothetical protein
MYSGFLTALLISLAMAAQTPVEVASPQSVPVLEDFDAGQTFVGANAAYDSGDYERAVKLYSSLLEHGIQNGHIYYNLGNAFLRNGELGRAIVSYRRCQRLLPRDEDVRANLDFARKSAQDALQAPEPSPALRTLFFWHYGLSRAELLRAVVLLNFALWGVLSLLLYFRRSEVMRWSFMVLLILLVATASSLVVRVASPGQVAVVIAQEVDAHSGTSTDTVVRFKLHAGSEVRALEVRDGWIRIALPDGQQAWIQAEHAELLTI